MAPHSSTAGHLATETALLAALYKRSKDQHRSQLFLRRLEGVLRLSKRVIKAVAATPATATPVGDTANDTDALAELAELVPRLLQSLVTAARASDAVLALGYFVPLHAALLAGYSRIFAVALALASALGIDPDGATEVVKPKRRRVGPEASRPPRVQATTTTTTSLLNGEIGERVERVSAPTSRANSHVPKSTGHSPPPALKRKIDDGGVMAKKRKKGLSLGTGESRTPSGEATPVDSDDDRPRPESSLSSAKQKLVGRRRALPSRTLSPASVGTPATSSPSSPGTLRADRAQTVADRPDVPSPPPKKVKSKTKSKGDKAANEGEEKPIAKAKDKSKKRRKQDAMDDIFGF